MRFNRISRRIIVQICIDIVLIAGANAAAFLLKYDPGDPRSVSRFHLSLSLLPFLIAFRVIALWRCHLYRIHWRYMSIRDLWAVIGATAISSALFYILLTAVGKGSQGSYSWGLQIIDALLNVLAISGVRVGYRQASDRVLLGIPVEPEAPSGQNSEPATAETARNSAPAPENPARPRQRALIVGAGDAGETVARDLLRRPQEGIVPIGFVDDDPLKRRTRIHGLPVMGTTHDIYDLTVEHGFDIILIALPHAPGRTLRDILSRCEKTQARLCIMPSVPEMLNGSVRLGPMRDIHIEDLLRRDAVHIDMEAIATYISGQRVLITGGGGSIGSELCRQICALNPARLLLLGRGENSVFEIEQELIREFGFAPTALIGDVQDRNRMEEIFLLERPTVVFHAAAHKHVPLMEANPQEAVKNNIEGTRNVAELAAACGVKKFIYVSTDKAVNPSSVMGATKRIGEMIIQSMAATTQTEFAAVRFGNVLGSRGSVIPTMRKQIARGGPVTVTDRAMTRFFMTIPEAVQLILQAGVLGRHGEIFLLDMGEPVRILDLARDLIRLSGLRPDIDIRIEFTGIRPGEKINEELLYSDEERNRSVHEKIFVSNLSETVSAGQVMREVDRLIRLAREGERGDSLRDEVLRVARSTFALPEGKPTAPPAPTPTNGVVSL
jgi:FlaA1/EpsC-like NDP-sugar epimerase